MFVRGIALEELKQIEKIALNRSVAGVPGRASAQVCRFIIIVSAGFNQFMLLGP